jgi:hypothetical protein
LRSGTAERCPDESALRKAVARRLGYDPFIATAPHTIVAEVSGNGAELQARARLVDDAGIVRGTRELASNGTDCAELLNSLTLAISMTLDPLAPAVEPESSAPDVSEAPRVATSPAAKTKPVEPKQQPQLEIGQMRRGRTAANEAPSNQRSTVLSTRGGVLGVVGWVPALSVAAELSLSLRHHDWSMGLDVVAVAPRSENSPQGFRAKVSVNYAALTPCYWVSTVGVCPLVALGRYSGQSAGVDAPRAGSHLFAAAGIRGQAMLPLTARWSVGAHVDGVRNLTRPEFLVSGQTVYQPSPWAANLGIFVDWQLL